MFENLKKDLIEYFETPLNITVGIIAFIGLIVSIIGILLSTTELQEIKYMLLAITCFLFFIFHATTKRNH